MDDADRAQVYIEQQEEARQQELLNKPAVESANECIQCGSLIPSARQLAAPGCQLCIGCAELAELRC